MVPRDPSAAILFSFRTKVDTPSGGAVDVPGWVPGKKEEEAGVASSSLKRKLLNGYGYVSLFARADILDGCE